MVHLKENLKGHVIHKIKGFIFLKKRLFYLLLFLLPVLAYYTLMTLVETGNDRLMSTVRITSVSVTADIEEVF